jgi:HEAT repeat protein
MTHDDLGRQEQALKRFKSREWADFVDNFFGDPYILWHDGVDEGAVLRLKDPEEKRAAEDMLIAALPAGMAAARGLALLRSERAIAGLEKAMTSTGLDYIRVHIADALEQITHNGRHLPAIIECLKGGANDQDRIEAAIALGKYRTPEVIAALIASVADKEYLVRYHACNALLRMHGFGDDISQHDDIFVNILKDAPSVKFMLAQEQLKALFSRKKPRKKAK